MILIHDLSSKVSWALSARQSTAQSIPHYEQRPPNWCSVGTQCSTYLSKRIGNTYGILRKQKLIIQNNKRENEKRKDHTYSIGDQVMISDQPNRKHGADFYKGPYTVSKVNDNGTVELRRDADGGGALSETWNIRNIYPCKA